MEDLEISDDLRSRLVKLGVSVLIVAGFAAAHNLATPDEPVRVGMVEVETDCAGLDAGICLGIQRQDHRTFNYDNYSRIEKGTPNFYRKVESELMLRAYGACGDGTEGMEWTSEVSYRNRTADEWLQNEQVDLLPCEETFHRDLDARN
ncbi:MAG: hypothetical protein ABEJ03_03280 [Candidatus Nanohaloarchaea archaeon]